MDYFNRQIMFIPKGSDEANFIGGVEIDFASLFSVLRNWTLCRSRMLMEDKGCDNELVGAKGACCGWCCEVLTVGRAGKGLLLWAEESSSGMTGSGGGGGADKDELLSMAVKGLLLTSTEAEVVDSLSFVSVVISESTSSFRVVGGISWSCSLSTLFNSRSTCSGSSSCSLTSSNEFIVPIEKATVTGAWRWFISGEGRLGLAPDPAVIFIDFKYSDGLISVSVSEGDGNFGGMNGKAICLFNMMCLPDPSGPPPLKAELATWCWSEFCWSERNDSVIASPMSAGRDSGRFKRAWPVSVTNQQTGYKNLSSTYLKVAWITDPNRCVGSFCCYEETRASSSGLRHFSWRRIV